MRLNALEKDNLDQLSEAYTALAQQYTDRDNRPLHVPHGVMAFAHAFFHEVFEEAATDQAMHAHAAAGLDPAESLDENIVMGIDLEPLLRKTYEMLILTGIEFGRRQNLTAQCRCIESLGDSVEEALHNGECGH